MAMNSAVNVRVQELSRGDWIDVDGEPRRITMISLTSIDRDYLITFAGGDHRVYGPGAKVSLLQFAEKVPVVRMDQLTAKLRQEFIVYVRGSEQADKSVTDRSVAKILAAGLAEVRFYLETGLELTEQTREQFEARLALWWEEALTAGDVLRD